MCVIISSLWKGNLSRFMYAHPNHPLASISVMKWCTAQKSSTACDRAAVICVTTYVSDLQTLQFFFAGSLDNGHFWRKNSEPQSVTSWRAATRDWALNTFCKDFSLVIADNFCEYETNKANHTKSKKSANQQNIRICVCRPCYFLHVCFVTVNKVQMHQCTDRFLEIPCAVLLNRK